MPDRRLSPLHPPPNLLSLPKELLTQIALHLDRPSAISLARVCRSLTASAEHRIWRDIDLFLPEHYGEYPLVQPHARSGSNQYCAWAKAEAKRAEDRHRMGSKEKVKTIMNRADERRWGLVEKVTVVPRTEAVHGIIQILDFVSPSLKVLAIDAPARHVFDDAWTPAIQETLDYKLLDTQITFSRLTHIRFGKRALKYAFLVNRLLEMAPGVVSLDVDLTSCIEDDLDNDAVGIPVVPYSAENNDSIKHMRIAFNEQDDATRDFALDLIRSSSSLEVLQADYEWEDLGWTDLLEAAASLQVLRDFSCPIDVTAFEEHFGRDSTFDGIAFPKLRRLMASSEGTDDLFRELPAFPSLEIIYFTSTKTESRLVPTNFPEYAPTCMMTPHMAKQLRIASTLKAVRSIRSDFNITAPDSFGPIPDSDDNDDSPRMIVRSLRHGSEELLHVRILDTYIEVRDSRNGPIARPYTEYRSLQYKGANGERYEKRFEACDSACWQDYTDFDGHIVPLNILRKMRRASGAKMGEWEGRGVEAGAKAWKVLTDWRDETVAKEKASKVKVMGKKADEGSKANSEDFQTGWADFKADRTASTASAAASADP